MEVKFLDLSYVNAPYYEEFSHKLKEMYFDSRFIKSVECAQLEEEFQLNAQIMYNLQIR